MTKSIKYTEVQKQALIDVGDLARLIYNGDVSRTHWGDTDFEKSLYERYGNPVPTFETPNTALDAILKASGLVVKAFNSQSKSRSDIYKAQAEWIATWATRNLGKVVSG
tara:strand:+ start:99 stop:425 length:327 start_codon:yes stop_codon:yes gene_type:complete